MRKSADHKGTFGHVLIIAGSPGKTGAAILAAQGALRCGTGLVSLCATVETNQIFETSLAEAMTIPVSGYEAGVFSITDYQDIIDAIAGKRALVLGPGLGTAPETIELVAKLYQEIELPMLVDADGLNALATDPTLFAKSGGPRILTPHPGEMARMTGKTSMEIQHNRLNAAESFAKDNGVVVLLKGAGTIIAAPDGRTAVNPTGNAGMAVGGMGDVLSGLIGGLLAQGVEPWEAACIGAFCHGRAGDNIAELSGIEMGYTASELASEIPNVLKEVLTDE